MVDLDFYEVTAKGRVYRYAWRGKGAPRLFAEPGSAAFIQELADALATRKTGDTRKISGLCAMFRASDLWREKLSDKTKASWSPWLDRIQEHFGPLSIAQFDRPGIRPEIKRWRKAYAKTPRAADMGVQVLSRLLAFGVDEGKLTTNACAGLARLYRNDRSDVIWTEDDLKELEKFASPELMWAARLAMHTGLRQGDLLRLSWSHIKKDSIEIRTGKSREKKTAEIPIHDELRALLDEIPKRSTVVLTSTDKRPWKTGFGSSWGKAVKAAKIDKHFHDLRGTAATKFYLANFTTREIAQIMTWGEDHVESLIDRYVKKDELLKDKIRRMRQNRASTETAKPAAKHGSNPV